MIHHTDGGKKDRKTITCGYRRQGKRILRGWGTFKSCACSVERKKKGVNLRQKKDHYVKPESRRLAEWSIEEELARWKVI